VQGTVGWVNRNVCKLFGGGLDDLGKILASWLRVKSAVKGSELDFV
jgi:hypothetical protein